METVDVDGIRIAYTRVGDGPALVLLHGYAGDGRTTWRPQLDELSNEFTVVAWDSPGAGQSSDPPEAFGMAGYADCLAGFVDALGLAEPHVAGLSSGGALALEFYRRHPAIPKSLVLASAYAGWAGSLPPDVTEQRMRQALLLSDLSPEEFVGALLPTMFSPGTPAEYVDAFGAAMQSVSPAWIPGHGSCGGRGPARALPLIAVPTLLVYGDNDVRAPLTVAERLHAEIAGSTLVVLPGAGHVCNIEAASEFNRTVRTFLRDRRI